MHLCLVQREEDFSYGCLADRRKGEQTRRLMSTTRWAELMPSNPTGSMRK